MVGMEKAQKASLSEISLAPFFGGEIILVVMESDATRGFWQTCHLTSALARSRGK
jgi:hypothetical protein